jgi:uracil-DNA glycosylase
MAADDIRNELLLLRELGFTHLDVKGPMELPPPLAAGPAAAQPASGRRRSEEREAPEAGTAFEEEAAPPGPAEQRAGPTTHEIVEAEDITGLSRIAATCVRCRLAQTRTQVVYGVGNPNADLMFVGEAPGRDEDLKGEPFVGRAGQLLTDIIKAMKLTRDDVYIANVIKCRPPENRNPEPDELDTCRPYIKRQIELIKPKVIVTLGRFALQSLTEKGYSISSVRGQWLTVDGIKVMPTYHPAYLLRTPAAKKDVWKDMQKVMVELGLSA